jgi:hypothetical protein
LEARWRNSRASTTRPVGGTRLRRTAGAR